MAISDPVALGIVTLIGTMFTAWMSYKNAKMSQTNHALLNSRWGIQLKLTSVLARQVATDHPTKANIDAAELAEQLSKEHDAKK